MPFWAQKRAKMTKNCLQLFLGAYYKLKMVIDYFHDLINFFKAWFGLVQSVEMFLPCFSIC